MMNKIFFAISFSVLLFLTAFAFVGPISAANPFDISYPVEELGNCESQDACETFCDEPANQDACFAWAADNGFIPEEEVEKIKRQTEKMEQIEKGELPPGPGGCDSLESCDAFCSEPGNAEECLSFATDNGFVSEEEAEQIREEINRENRVGPGGCDSLESCDAFCSEPENTEKCLNFAVEDGMMTQDEADFMLEMTQRQEEFMDDLRGPRGPRDPRGPGSDIDEEKVLGILEAQNGPGGCDSLESCDSFCSEPGNEEECFNFAKENDLIPEEELEFIEKIMETGGPGGCQGEQECDDFCSEPENTEECMSFSVDVGMMTQGEADRMIDQIKRMENRGRMMEEEFGGGRDTRDFDRRDDFGPRGDSDRRGERGEEEFFFPPEGRDDFGAPEEFFDEEGNFVLPENMPEDVLRQIQEKDVNPEDVKDMMRQMPEEFMSEGMNPGDFMPRDLNGDDRSDLDREGEFNRDDFERFDDFENFEKDGRGTDDFNGGDFEPGEMEEGFEGFIPEGVMPEEMRGSMMEKGEGEFERMFDEFSSGDMPTGQTDFKGDNGEFIPPAEFSTEGEPTPGFDEGFVPPEEFSTENFQDFVPPADFPAGGEENFDGSFQDFQEPVTLRNRSILGTVFGPFLDIFR